LFANRNYLVAGVQMKLLLKKVRRLKPAACRGWTVAFMSVDCVNPNGVATFTKVKTT